MASIVVNGDTSGAVTLSAPAVAGTVTVTLPSANGTMAVLPTATGVLAESAGGTGTSTGYYGFKNRIINGAMVIDQRNAGATTTPADFAFITDRWQVRQTTASKFSAGQSSVVPAGFTKSLLFTSLSAYSVSASDVYVVREQIEGFNTADLNWGTSDAQSVTLSFWVRSSLTGTFGGAFINAANNRNYVFTYAINTANTWEYKTITVAGDTTGTWETGNLRGVMVTFGLGVGSTSSGTAGAWGATNFASATGATSVVGTNGATFYITGVQLEKGSTATSFDYRPYGTELALCQRYCEIGEVNVTGAYINTGIVIGSICFKVTKRASPTLSYSGTPALYVNSATPTASSPITDGTPTVDIFSPRVTSTAAASGAAARLTNYQFLATSEL